VQNVAERLKRHQQDRVRGLHMVQAWRARLSTLMGELRALMDIKESCSSNDKFVSVFVVS